MLHSALSHDPSGMKRFVSEARAVNRIRHRNIVDIFAFGALPDGAQYLVMERLEGRTLTDYLKERRTTSYTDARAILAQVLDALEAAHQRNIVHRDLKPDNIFLCDQPGGGWLVKLMDFGIAKFADDTGSTHMTKTGVPMGTPLYMSQPASHPYLPKPDSKKRANHIPHRTNLQGKPVMFRYCNDGNDRSTT